jgi:hypothetical protein
MKSWLHKLLRYLFLPNRGVKPEVIESELGKALVVKNRTNGAVKAKRVKRVK